MEVATGRDLRWTGPVVGVMGFKFLPFSGFPIRISHVRPEADSIKVAGGTRERVMYARVG